MNPTFFSQLVESYAGHSYTERSFFYIYSICMTRKTRVDSPPPDTEKEVNSWLFSYRSAFSKKDSNSRESPLFTSSVSWESEKEVPGPSPTRDLLLNKIGRRQGKVLRMFTVKSEDRDRKTLHWCTKWTTTLRDRDGKEMNGTSSSEHFSLLPPARSANL